MDYKNRQFLPVVDYSPGQILDVYNSIKSYNPDDFKNYIRNHGLPRNINLPYMMMVLSKEDLIEEFVSEYCVQFGEQEKQDLINSVLCNGNLKMLQYLATIDFDILNQETFNLACDKSTVVIVNYLVINSKNIVITDENIKRSFTFNNPDVTTLLLHRLIVELNQSKERFKYVYSLGIAENSKRLIDLCFTVGIPFPDHITCKEELLYLSIINKSPSVVKLLIVKYNVRPDFGQNDCLNKAIELKLIYIIDILLQWYIENHIVLKIDKEILNLESIKDLITFDCIESACYMFYVYYKNKISFILEEEILSLTEISKMERSNTNFIGYLILFYHKNNIDITKPTQRAFSNFGVLSKLISIGGLDTAIHYKLRMRNNIGFDTVLVGLENYAKYKSLSKKLIFNEFFEKLKQITGEDESKDYVECCNLLPFDDMTKILFDYLN